MRSTIVNFPVLPPFALKEIPLADSEPLLEQLHLAQLALDIGLVSFKLLAGDIRDPMEPGPHAVELRLQLVACGVIVLHERAAGRGVVQVAILAHQLALDLMDWRGFASGGCVVDEVLGNGSR